MLLCLVQSKQAFLYLSFYINQKIYSLFVVAILPTSIEYGIWYGDSTISDSEMGHYAKGVGNIYLRHLCSFTKVTFLIPDF